MAKRICLLVLLCLFVSSLFAVEKTSFSLKQEKEAGYALLDDLVGMFQKMAATGTGGRDKVDETLAGFMAEAKKSHAEKRIDSVFFYRYNRLLMMIKLAIVEDKEGILGPLIEREVGAFIAETTGVKPYLKGKKAIAEISDAIAQGVLDLHLYLDTKKERKRLMEEFQKKFEAEVKKEK